MEKEWVSCGDSSMGEMIAFTLLWKRHRFYTGLPVYSLPNQNDKALMSALMPFQFVMSPVLSSLLSHAQWHAAISIISLLIMHLTWQAAVFILSAKLANSCVKSRWLVGDEVGILKLLFPHACALYSDLYEWRDGKTIPNQRSRIARTPTSWSLLPQCSALAHQMLAGVAIFKVTQEIILSFCLLLSKIYFCFPHLATLFSHAFATAAVN